MLRKINEFSGTAAFHLVYSQSRHWNLQSHTLVYLHQCWKRLSGLPARRITRPRQWAPSGPVFSFNIDALIQRSLTKDVPQEAHDLETPAFERPDNDRIEFKTQCSTATRQCHHILQAMKKVDYNFCGLKPSIPVLKKLQVMPPHVHSIVIEVGCIAAAKGPSL